MEQESTYKRIAVIGLGASGGLFGILASKNPYNLVSGFDARDPFSTLLPTGGGRCNLTYNEDNVREFVRNYPRGEKFLLSVFSRMPQSKTRELFRDLGIKTYVQNDNRVFPITDSSAKTVKILQKHLDNSNFNHIKENIISITKKSEKFEIKTSSKTYEFECVVVATGGKGIKIAEMTGHKIIEPKPSLTALNIKEKEFYSLSGMSFKNAEITAKYQKSKYSAVGDILFTHKAISGPCVFKISALTAYENFSSVSPMEINIKLVDCTLEDIEYELKVNSKKTIKNVFTKFAPEKFISCILKMNKINETKQAAQINKSEKEILFKSLTELKLYVEERIKDSEIVTAGGVELNEINSKTMESKLIPNLFFIGEILNIDGYTGGFNLQSCWSTAYLCSLNFN